MPLTIPVGNRYAHALNDGFFRAPRNFFDVAGVYERVAGEAEELETPVGAFLWPGERNVLVDAGVGPIDYLGRGRLVGGQLLDELRCLRLEPNEIHTLALSHLHPDHAGWVATPDGEITFKNATIVLAQAEWNHFMFAHRDQLADHLIHALQTHFDQGRVELVDGEREIGHGLRLIPAPGHTPGHSLFSLHDHDDRLLLLGDAIFCPLQLTETDVATLSDMDKDVARRTREAIARELEIHETRSVGCHFPGLTVGRILGKEWTVQ